MSSSDPGDAYARLQYRRLIAWPERIRREEPFLLRLFAAAPARSLLDLGCGTGEHAIHFARAGFQVVGIDRSEAQLQEARRQSGDADVRFLQGDLRALPDLLAQRFGAAICLGNTLVHLHESAELESFCCHLHAVLLSNGTCVVQILNYERILGSGVRHLPLNFREEEEAEIVFLRLLRPLESGRIQFMPTTLRVRPQSDEPVEVVASRSVIHRAWLRSDLEPALRDAGFESIQWFGDMSGAEFHAETSTDLVFTARRSARARAPRSSR
ncbi:MAG: class I SAM-dependent methyltransferase [Candidatus Latescibacterota bacterium]|nr:MAG: class I SAM-dependent methyltransferase [Candidatus Latescibacterota bacterium]